VIRKHDGYRELSEPEMALRLVRWLANRIWTRDERPELLFELASAWLRKSRILLPGASTLMRLVLRARERMESRLYRRLVAVASPAEIDRLEDLLLGESGDEGRALLETMRRGPQRVSGRGLVEATDRLAAVRLLGGERWDLRDLPNGRLSRLAAEAMASGRREIRRMPALQRRAMLVAFVYSMRHQAQDDVLNILDLHLRMVLGRVLRKDRRERMRSIRAFDRAARDLAAACAALLDDGVSDSAVRQSAFARVPSPRLREAVATVEELAGAKDLGDYAGLAKRGPELRRFLPGLLRELRLEANASGLAVLEAWRYLAKIEGRRNPDLGMAPTEIIRGPWRDLVWQSDGTLHRGLYSWCVLDLLRDKLRRRDIYAPESRDFCDPRASLLQGRQWADARPRVRRALGLPESGANAIANLRDVLADAYRVADGALDLPTGWRFKPRDGALRPSLARLERIEEPASLTALRARIAASLPVIDLAELLLEVDAWTGLSTAMIDARREPSRSSGLNRSICAALLAQACNIGLRAVTNPMDPSLTRDRLEWVQRHYLGGDGLRNANARLVDAQSALPLAQVWGGGHVASADGLRFVVPVRSAHAAPNSRYFGMRRGLTYYNFVSDQHTGFHAVIVPGTMRDSLFVLDGLLEHCSRLEPQELMVDTAGYSDAVFGLFWLLGYQFSPRLRDISDLRFWRLDPQADHGRLNPLARHAIRPARIEQHWEDLLRIAGSLRLGTARASDFMRTLQAGGRVSHIRQAVVELGRIVKTLYLLAYISDADYRRRILIGLNRGESRHALARSVFFGQLGELRQPYRQGQEDQLGALGLVVNAIALWNTVYMGDALAALVDSAEPEPDRQDIGRLSPLLHGHIQMVGRYRFELPAPQAEGIRRPIALPVGAAFGG
jgi:TnpA family transposase